MSLSELFSFAVSGSAASTVSALVAGCVFPDEQRGRPRPTRQTRQTRQRDTHPSSPPIIASRAAAKGFIFFFTYYVAATAQFNVGASGKSTRRAATDAFLVGATASVFTRLFGPSTGGPEAPAGHRWSLPALEDDVVLAIDPGLTFCVQEVLARCVGDMLSRRQQQQPQPQPQPQSQRGLYGSAVVAAAQAFLLAAASKAVATGLTYPLRAAAAEATEQRWAARAAEDEGDGLEDERPTGTRAAGRHGPRGRAPGKRQHNVLPVLLQMLRAGGVRSLYVHWLRSVVAAALEHGLTMTLQRSLFGYILRVVSSMRAQRTRNTATAAATPTPATTARAPTPDKAPPPTKAPTPTPTNIPTRTPSKAQAPTPTKFPTRTPTRTPTPTPTMTPTMSPTMSPTMTQTMTATMTPSTPPTTPRSTPRSPPRSPPRSAPVTDLEIAPTVVASPTPTTFAKPETPIPIPAPFPTRLRQPEPLDTSPPEPMFDEPRAHVKSAVESWLDSTSVASDSTVEVNDSVSNISARRRRPAAAPPVPPREMALVRHSGARHPRDVAGVASSRASEPTAFYPDAVTAGRRHLSHIQANHDDDNASLIFNMVSKSPRVIKGRRERL